MNTPIRLIAAMALLTTNLSAADDWTRFRGPNGSGVSASSGVPAEFGPEKNVVWKTAVPFGRSSPVISGNRIFLTATEGEKLLALCLDRQTGKILWRSEIARPRATAIFKANDGASPTPATDGKNLYAFFADLGLISFGPDGKERWRVPLGPFDTFYGIGSSPIVAGNTVLMLCDTRTKAFLIAVDAASGKVRWRAERGDIIKYEGYTSPVIYEPEGQPAQVLVMGAQHLDAYSLANGERLWWVREMGSFPVASPIIGKGLVIVSAEGADAPFGPTYDEMAKMSDTNGDGRVSREEFVATQKEFGEHFGWIDADHDGFVSPEEWNRVRMGMVGNHGMVAVKPGGRGDLTDSAIVWRVKKNYSTMPSALLYKDVLYIVKTGGIIGSFDPQTGNSFKVERTKEAMEEYSSSPVAADDKIFLTSESGKVTVLKSGQQWEILAVNDMKEDCNATPAIVDGKIFIRTRTALYSFGKK
ncbi:MAG: PQQ-binding-like beta-propeller repeat protein [Acidobacteria bacterium]|nr:PQQ-binding-like beta-propeller repeat protein [Acidobacteriota bacterium]